MLSVATNTVSINAQRMLRNASSQQAQAMERLSSGLRINSAADDAAGMQISNRLNSQVSGLGVAMRNANDGISMLQTAEGALNESTNIILRLKELSVQAANGSNSTEDKQAIQAEVDQLLSELDRINETTSFGDRKLFESSDTSLVGGDAAEEGILGLLSGWMHEAEERIRTYYGIEADNVDIEISFLEEGDPSGISPGDGGVLAFVRYTGVDALGRGLNLELVIDKEDFEPLNAPNGGDGPLYGDRIIAHEMVHAVFNRAVNVQALPTWFNEGAAEFIAGGDERLASDVAANGGNGAGLLAAVDTFGAWPSPGTSAYYSEAYAAVRYMHEEIKNAGGNGIKDITEYLENNIGGADTLDDALANASSGAFTGEADFESSFNTNGAAFIDGLIAGGQLSNDDVGAIGGLDADGGPSLNAEDVMPNTSTAADPTVFNEIGLELSTTVDSSAQAGKGEVINFQVGAESNESIDISFSSFNATALGLDSLDVVYNPQVAINAVDRALTFIDSNRAEMGAVQNRLESTISNLSNIQENVSAGLSRIKDTDFALETAELTKSQILTQISSAILAQAQQLPQAALSLLG